MPALSAKAKLVLVALAALVSIVLLVAVAGSLDGRDRLDVGSATTTVPGFGPDATDDLGIPVLPGPVTPGVTTLPEIQPVGPTSTARAGGTATTATTGAATGSPGTAAPSPTAPPVTAPATTAPPGSRGPAPTPTPTTAAPGPAVTAQGTPLQAVNEPSRGGVNEVPPRGCSVYGDPGYTDVECGAGGNGLFYSVATRPGTPGDRIVSVWVDASTDAGLAVRRVLRAQGTFARVRAITGAEVGEVGEDLFIGIRLPDGRALVEIVRPAPGGAAVVVHVERGPNGEARVVGRQVEVYRATESGDVVDVVAWDRNAYRVVRTVPVSGRPGASSMNLTS